MKSMTGFGRSEVDHDGRTVSIELKSVNHRYLDLNIRMPRAMSAYEDVVRNMLKASLSRGHVDVFINYKNTRIDSRAVEVNASLSKAYYDAMQSIRKATGAAGRVNSYDIARMPDVLNVTEAAEDEQELIKLLGEAAGAAISGLVQMRGKEGLALRKDITERLAEMEKLLTIIAERAPGIVSEYRDKLVSRISELLKGTEIAVDDSKISSEVAFYADRCSIDEETVRLRSHMEQMIRTMDEEDSVGRRLDFIVQEMNREVNTICSKANDISITNAALLLKNEIEKIREQVQNVE